MNEQTITETTQTVKIADLEMKDIDLEALPKKRYEIQIKKEHFNFWFGIVEVSFLAHNIMLTQPLPIVNAPMGGVYRTAEDAAYAALAYLKRTIPDAEIIVSVKTGNDPD